MDNNQIFLLCKNEIEKKLLDNKKQIFEKIDQTNNLCIIIITLLIFNMLNYTRYKI